MNIAVLPVDEDVRLNNLYSYDLLDSKQESDFDDLVDIAGLICGCPISIISLVDKDRQWFKAKKGLANSETPRRDSFCAHAILQDGIMEVHDAQQDERFYDNPLVTGEPNIRFYAGSPILSPAGHKLGTICVIDHTPRTLTIQQEKALNQLSSQVGKLIELREKNRLIRQRTEEIIAIKNSAITQVMQQSWKENKQIAYELHEDLAQEIAGCLLSLQSSQNDKANSASLVDSVKSQLRISLSKIREMSYSIAPMTNDWLPVESLVEEYVEKVAGTFPFGIRLNVAGKKNQTGSDKTAVLIHIIEAWLTRLAIKTAITEVNITLNISSSSFELTMEDNAAVNDILELSDHVYAALLKEMAVAEAGRVDIDISGSGKNMVKVTIPVNDPAV